MASQMYGVTGNRRLKRNQTAELRARLGHLPTMLQQEQEDTQHAEEMKFRREQFAQQKEHQRDQMQFSREQAKKGFGLELGKLGINVATGGLGSGITLGSLGNEAKSLFKIGGGASSTGTPTPSTGVKGFFGKMPVGSIAAGGLGGFGMGKLTGATGTSKKLLYGGLTGAGLGLLSGGLSGAVGGGLAGMFGGLIS